MSDLSAIEGKKYYDISDDLDEVMAQNGYVEDLFYLRDLRRRKLRLSDDIDQYNSDDLVGHIQRFNCDDIGIEPEERQPIILYINTNGGEVDSGFAIVDAILCSKTPVYTVNVGCWYSMGFLIGIAGHKRFAMPNSKFLIHDGSEFVYGSGTKVADEIEFRKKVNEQIKSLVLSQSILSEEEYEAKRRVEWYMLAKEAKGHGFIDEIVGIDCDIDSIL